MPFNPLQRFTSLHRVVSSQSFSPKGKGKERLDLVIIPTSSLVIEHTEVTSSRHSIASTASSSSSITLEEAMIQNVTLEQRELTVVHSIDHDHLYLRGGTYILLSRESSLDGDVYTYLGPNGHKLQTHLGPSETPIKCLLHNHKPKLIRTEQDLSWNSTWYRINTHEKWLMKNGKVECSACGATLRERTVKRS